MGSILEALGAIILGGFAAGIIFAVLAIYKHIQLLNEQIRKARIDAIKWWDVPEGKVAVSDIIKGKIVFDEFYSWPGVDDDEREIAYRAAERPPDMYVRNDAREVIRQSLDMYGHNGNQLIGIDKVKGMTESRWRAARAYLAQWEIVTYTVGDASKHEAGTFIGPLHDNLKQLEQNVLHHRVPVATPPPQGG